MLKAIIPEIIETTMMIFVCFFWFEAEADHLKKNNKVKWRNKLIRTKAIFRWIKQQNNVKKCHSFAYLVLEMVP